MPSVEILPTSVVKENGTAYRSVGGGAPSVLAALTDGSDTTWVEMAGSVYGIYQLWVGFGDMSAVPAGARITGFQTRMRYRDQTITPSGLDAILPHAVITGTTVAGQTNMESHSAFDNPRVGQLQGGATVRTYDAPIRSTTTWARGLPPAQYLSKMLNRAYPPLQQATGVGGFTVQPRTLYASFHSWRLYSTTPPARAKLVSVSMLVHYELPPTADIVSPAPSGVAIVSRPTIDWEYQDAEGKPQLKYDLYVYKAADVAQPDFYFGDARKGAARIGPEVYANGKYKPVFAAEEFTALTQATPTRAIGGDGDGFRAYVRVHHGMAGGQWVYSAWDSVDFTLDIATPKAPGLLGAVDTSLNAITLIAAGSDNLLSWLHSSTEPPAGESIGVAGTFGPGWKPGLQTTISRVTTPVLHGSGALSMVNAAGSAQTISARAGQPNLREAYRVDHLVGQQITLMGWFRAATTGRTCRMEPVFYDEPGTTGTIAATPTYNAAPTDTTSGWVQARTTVTVPAGAYWLDFRPSVLAAASGEQHFVEQAGLYSGVVTAWNQGGWLYSPYGDAADFELQRSLDAGVTWETIPDTRATLNPQVEQLEYIDYELPSATAASYRARVTNVDPEGNPQTSPWSNVVTLTMPTFTKWWLRDIWELDNPLSMTLKVAPGFQITTPKPSTGGYALGDFGATITHDGVKADVLDMEVNLLSKAAYDEFRKLIDSGRTLLLQDPFGRQWWVQADDGVKYSMLRAVTPVGENTPVRHAHVVAVTFVTVNRPTSFGG